MPSSLGEIQREEEPAVLPFATTQVISTVPPRWELGQLHFTNGIRNPIELVFVGRGEFISVCVLYGVKSFLAVSLPFVVHRCMYGNTMKENVLEV